MHRPHMAIVCAATIAAGIVAMASDAKQMLQFQLQPYDTLFAVVPQSKGIETRGPRFPTNKRRLWKRRNRTSR